ncbi:MAG TPA: hypothetical protein VMF30_10930 [Pirellulales bacterium]|nr:hypothetical protein [Pirellulales bacterium]
MSATPATSNVPAPQAPSTEIRGLVSLLLFIHLFVVAIGLVSYTAPSALEEELRKFFAPYLATLNFDLNPNAYPTGRFYMTHDLPVDVDAQIHVDATLPSGEERSITIPEPGLWPPERRRHYQAMANAASTLVGGDEEYQPVLPRSIAGSILRSWGAARGTVRIDRHLPLQIQEAESGDPERSDPFGRNRYSPVYEAQVLVSPSGQVDISKKIAAGEAAPVDRNAVDKSAPGTSGGEKKAGDRPSAATGPSAQEGN